MTSTAPPLLQQHHAMLHQVVLVEVRGTVVEVRGLALHVADLPLPVGAMVRIESASLPGQLLHGEVIGFSEVHTLVMPFGSTAGVRRGDRVCAEQHAPTIRVGNTLIGRVVNALGNPVDGKGPLQDAAPHPISAPPVDPMDRPPIDAPLATGVRAVDALLSVGRGQRLGIFAAPGVGKSTLLAMMARHTAADVSVIGLVGERGREVRDFLDNQLGADGLARSVVVFATGDESPLLRMRAAMAASAIAEFFRDQGRDVLLLVDSITRFCQAQRQIGLAAGEPPATKGYPPSVFAMLPVLLERSGRTSRGSITGLYSVLVEGDDMNEPIADAARGILDGHFVLSRHLAHRNHWPAIDAVESISRVVDDVTDPAQQAARRLVLRLLSDYRQVEDLLNIGAYVAGSNPDYDLAIAAKPLIERLLQQGRRETQGTADFQHARQLLLTVAQQVEQAKRELGKQTRRAPAPLPARG